VTDDRTYKQAMADAADALRKADKLHNYIQDPKTDGRMRYVYENYYMAEALAQARDALGRAKQILRESLTMAHDALTS